LAELIAYAKANPTKVSAGTLGGATTQHLAAGLLNQLAKTDILLVPYKGSAPAMNDLVSGHVQMMFNAMPSTIPYVKAGRLRALAVTGLKRSPQAAELPTVAETLPGYEILTWWGVLAPAGTPQPTLDRLYREILTALNESAIKARLGDMGVEINPSGPAAFGALARSEIAKWSEVIRALGVKPD